jgi:PAS domain S-box-containing protein
MCYTTKKDAVADCEGENMRSGHIVIDNAGLLVSLDHGFSGIMQAEIGALIGRAVLDITAPADRRECGEAIDRLRATRMPFEVSKRFIRDDGDLVWVKNSVSMVGNGRDTDLIVATISPIVEPDAPRAPALLLDCARILVELHMRRSESFERSLFSDTGWQAMLAAYIAEAEGRAISTQALAEKLQISNDQANRWLSVLIGQGMVEIETRETDPYAPKSFRLTGVAHGRLEDHLGSAGELIGATVRVRSFT